jgi:hypothetical protein
VSQSATWDALRLAADFRAWDRDEDAAHVMPDPEVAWVRFQTSQRSIRFFEDVAEEDGDEPPPPRGQQIREYRERWAKVDWLAWRSGARLNLTNFDAMIREHYNPQEVSRMALYRNPAFQMMARRGSPRAGFVFTIGDTSGQQYQQVWSDEAVDTYPGDAPVIDAASQPDRCAHGPARVPSAARLI